MDIDSAEPVLRFAALGPLRTWRGEQALDLGPGKQRAVLAVLLLDANRVVPAQRIVEAVWDDEPPENGANVVQKYVAGLRRVLEPERSPRAPSQVLTLSDGGYRLHVGDYDVQTFQARVRKAETFRRSGDLPSAAAELRRALELWRGQPLAGLTGRWLDARRQQLADQYAAAWEALAELELELGRHTGLTTELGRLVGEHPGREGLRAALMLALYRSGRQVEALAAYRDAQEHLREEFGVDPGDQLRELHRRILTSDPTLGHPVSPAAPAAAPPPPPPPPPERFPPPYPHPFPPPPLPDVRRTPHQTAAAWAKAILFALAALCTFGHATAFIVGYYAVRRRSVLTGIAAVLYLIATSLLWVSAEMQPPEFQDPNSPWTIWDTISIPGMMFPPFVGAAHVFALAISDLTRAEVIDRDAEIAGRMDRERALQIVTHDPRMARELRIGRHDLPRWFNDGGLVDVNAVPEYVLAQMPGMTVEQAGRILADRGMRGPYSSVYDLTCRHPDLRLNVAALHRFVTLSTVGNRHE